MTSPARAGSRTDFEDLVTTLQRHGVRPPVDSTWPVERIGHAFEHLERGGHLGTVAVTLGS